MPPPDPRAAVLARRCARIASTLAAAAAATGLAALAGWAFDLPALRSAVPGFVPMNPATAVLFVLAAAALDARARTGDVAARRRSPGGARLAAILAGAVAGIGAVHLVATLGGPDAGLDRLLFADRLADAGGGHPNRMAPNTAAAFTGLGISLLLLRPRRRAVLAQLLALGVGFIALVAIVGYAYGQTPLYGLPSTIPMAVNTAAGIFLLSLGAALVPLRFGLTSVFWRPGLGGAMARYLAPACLLLPVAFGWLRLLGERAGAFTTEFGVALMVVASMASFLALMLVAAHLLERSDRRLRESSLFFESIFENLPIMAFVKDARELRYARMNRAGEELLGRPRAELIGGSPADFFPAAQAATFRAEDLEVLASGRPLDVPEEMVRAGDGAVRVLHTRKVPLAGPDGGPAWLLGISEDVTDRKAAEERIRHLNQELEAFSYSVSHDLRAPLRAISGFSQALAEDLEGRLDDRSRDHLGRILGATRRMSDLIDGLLALSRIARTEVREEPVDVSALARAVADDLRAADPAREVELAIEDGLAARGDARLLHVALQNLLGNAWKYTRDRGGARIEVGRYGNGNGERGFFVRDNGAGFDMQYAHKLFGAFQRLHRADEFEGTGLGLATVQRIVHRHGGRIRGEGAVGEGAAFYISL